MLSFRCCGLRHLSPTCPLARYTPGWNRPGNKKSRKSKSWSEFWPQKPVNFCGVRSRPSKHLGECGEVQEALGARSVTSVNVGVAGIVPIDEPCVIPAHMSCRNKHRLYAHINFTVGIDALGATTLSYCAQSSCAQSRPAGRTPAGLRLTPPADLFVFGSATSNRGIGRMRRRRFDLFKAWAAFTYVQVLREVKLWPLLSSVVRKLL